MAKPIDDARISALEAQNASLIDRLIRLEAAPVCPHVVQTRADALAWERRVAESKRLEAEAADRLAAYERKNPPAARVRVACTDKTCGAIQWRENFIETIGGSEFFPKAHDPLKGHVERGEWKARTGNVERTESIAGRGYMIELAAVWTRRVVGNPELAGVVMRGDLTIEALTDDESRAIERKERITSGAMTPGLIAAGGRIE